jgi:N6-adenosine-specific RNA methylase IME4
MIFTDFPCGLYDAILVDPPWHFRTRSDKGRDRCADKHYPTMSVDDIKALPVIACAAKDCALFLWATDPMLPAALDVIRRWGFEFKTVAFTWVKTTKSGGFHIGCGYWSRANPEMCLLATRGRPKRLAKDVRQLIVAPRREHSRKPDEAYERIERLVRGPYLELFARGCRLGWDAWGNEAWKENAAKQRKLGGMGSTSPNAANERSFNYGQSPLTAQASGAKPPL